MDRDLTPLLRARGWISSAEAAALLGTSARYLEEISRRGRLPFHKIGILRFYSHAEVLEYKRTHPKIGKRYARLRAAAS